MPTGRRRSSFLAAAEVDPAEAGVEYQSAEDQHLLQSSTDGEIAVELAEDGSLLQPPKDEDDWKPPRGFLWIEAGRY